MEKVADFEIVWEALRIVHSFFFDKPFECCVPCYKKYPKNLTNCNFSEEPSEKSVEIMRKFSEQYAVRSETYFCADKGVTSVVIKVVLKLIFCPKKCSQFFAFHHSENSSLMPGLWNQR